MADQGNGGGETPLDRGIRHLNKRIQSSSLTVMVLAAGIVVPMAVDHSNKKKNQQQGTMHLPTVAFAYATFLSGLSLRGLVSEFMEPHPCRIRYIAIKALVHACALLLVSLSFSLSLMMRMYVVITSSTLFLSAALVGVRLRRCATTTLEADVDAFRGCEEKIQQLMKLSTSVASILFGGWFGMAFFYFQNYPEEARDARLLPSEYLTFFTSVASSLMLLKAVPGPAAIMAADPDRAVWELMAWICLLVADVVVTALVIAASKVRGYAAMALVPEAVALVVWGMWGWLPESLKELLRYGGGGGGEAGEPASQNFTLLLAVLTYRAKDVEALSSLYDEAFVMVTTAADAHGTTGGPGRGQDTVALHVLASGPQCARLPG